jgi:hypothetical protein
MKAHNQWDNIVIGHETGFYFECLQDHFGISSAEKALDFPDTGIAAQKRILAVFCNPNIFDVATIVFKGTRINAI